MKKLKIKKGDKVIVIAGKDKRKTGEVIKVFPAEDKIIVANVNLVKRHTKPSKTSEGGIISKELPIHISNVAHLDPEKKTPTRVGFRILKDGSKVRWAKKSGEVLGDKK